ncbi:glycine cleavage system regulatory protein [Marinomonas ushuaiensis DSM 15871]|uniref:Glycine cleavage system regulatory protein n=1 Tax=Marinomonas ushuaiensis DSM 15871 TaxID=1122207 RepID=X7E172_9GAMM|nr:LysR substrate-binding domain-containing protein [Marinomonas ushuaiensis]ETX09722.1 glycine cleavage system regulatory protein [Marinomonas ushuaiensis DSM 15871]
MSSNRLLPSLKSLLAFRYAAQSLSFKAAAEHLYVTQAAISQQIKTLEQALGVELFERHTRQVTLTTEGAYLFDYANKAFGLLEEGVKGVAEDSNPNTLVISAVPSFSNRWLVPRLGGFRIQEPEINLRLSPNSKLSTFLDTDLGVRLGEGVYKGLQSSLLFEEFLLPVCHPSLINDKEPIKKQLAKIPVITDTGPDMEHVWPIYQRFLDMYDMPINTQLHIDDSTALVEALLSRQGISMMRFSLVYEQIEKGQLVCPLPIYMKSRYDFYLVAPAHHFKRQKVMGFKRWIENEVKSIDHSWQEYTSNNPDFKEVTV